MLWQDPQGSTEHPGTGILNRPKPLMYGAWPDLQQPHSCATPGQHQHWQDRGAAAQGKAPLLAWPFPQPQENTGITWAMLMNTEQTLQNPRAAPALPQSPLSCHQPWG